MWLLARALVAFLILPGVVSFLVPWLMIRDRLSDQPVDLIGLIPLSLGIVLLLWCVGAFYREGRGTLAPWDPPRHLVVTGVYRLSRNPMYVAVVLLLWGWALTFRSASLALYALAVMIVFHLRVVFGEEPWLARAHGERWIRYKAQVPRWLGISKKNSRSED